MTTISTPPTAPDRSSPSTFSDRADAFVAWLETAVPDFNSVRSETNTFASNASSSAIAASTSETNTATSETNAAASKTAAAASAAAAAASEGAVEAVAIGSYADDAAADASGKTIVDGVFYYKNTAPKGLRLRQSGAWVNAVIDANGALVAANNLSDVDNAATALSNLGGLAFTWSTKTAAYTAVAGDRILADTSSAAFTVTLPASPTSGDEVWFADPGSNWGTNNLTVSGNGNNIDGDATFAADVSEGHFIATYNGTAWLVRFAGGTA